MRHKYKGRKLGTDYSHTKAMKRSLVSALFLNDRIKTIESRAKEIRGDVDKIITWAKRGDLHSRRLAMAALGNDSELVREIFDKVAQGMFADRNGGYTRIVKLGPRKGDNAPMVIMELITEALPAKKKKSEPAKAKAKKVEPAKADAKKEEVKEEKEAPKAKTEEEKAEAEKPADESKADEAKEEKAEAKEEVKEAKADSKAEDKEEKKEEVKEDAKA